jgi:hypothetical protein
MRVVRLEGYPQRAAVTDIDGNGCDEIILANTRQSRVEVFRWLAPDQRHAAPPSDPDNPNTLPMAVEFERDDVSLEQLPHDVVAFDLDDDGTLELLVLVSTPNRVIVCRREGDAWRQAEQWDLLPGEIASNEPLRLRAERRELLINFEDGIQTLKLAADERADWLAPRERHARVDWWLVDFDADGTRDLVTWTRKAGETIRLHRGTGDGLRPAVALYDKAINGAAVLETNGGAELLLLDQVEHGLLRRFVPSRGEPTPLGLRQAWPVSGPWCGLRLNDDRVMVTVDGEQPRLNIARLTDDGWRAGGDYPCVAGVRDIAPVVAQPGTLLLWTKDAADLYVSRWDGSRLSYPRPMVLSPQVEDRRIVAVGVVGETTWWAQRVGADVDLYTWSADDQAMRHTHFAELGDKIEDVRWVGGERLLYREQYKRTCKLAWIEGDKVVTAEPGHLAKAELAEFQLLAVDGGMRLARLTDGVLQWLDDGLHPVDQVMLPQGRQLIGYVPLSGGGGAWALQREGRFIHRLKPDDAGIQRIVATYETPGGSAMMRDPLIGLVLISDGRIVRLAEGQPLELQLLETIDSTVGRPGVAPSDTAIHRVRCVDITGDGADEVLLIDDQRHRITALWRKDDQLQPLASWSVFDDSAYPYGMPNQQLQQQPRFIAPANLDGDEHRDLIMLCHDRMLLYLGRSE